MSKLISPVKGHRKSEGKSARRRSEAEGIDEGGRFSSHQHISIFLRVTPDRRSKKRKKGAGETPREAKSGVGRSS